MRPPDAVQNLNGFGSIGCFENLKSRIAQATYDCQTQEHVVFHNQDERLRAPTAVHHRGLDGSTIETTTPP